MCDVHVNVHRVKLLKINQLDALISQIFPFNETQHVSDSSCVHLRSFLLYTQQWYM